MPSGRRTLSPDSLLDLDAVRAYAAAAGLRDADAKSVSRAAVVDGVSGGGGSCEEALLSRFAVTTSTVHSAHPTTAQRGFKLVVKLQDGQLVETVAIVHEALTSSAAAGGLPRRSHGRITVCVSSQVGCKMGCTFCATGTMGLRANLTAGEIVEQVWHVERTAPAFGVHWRVSNVVFMGMGEPLNNYKPVMGAVRSLRELWRLAPSRITISTVWRRQRLTHTHSSARTASSVYSSPMPLSDRCCCCATVCAAAVQVGVVNRIKTLAADAPGVSLALSLHAATQETRVKLVPSATAYTLTKLMNSLDSGLSHSARPTLSTQSH